VVNLFALRATDPAELARADDPVGPDNDRIIRDAAAHAPLTVVAWGAHRMAVARGQRVADMLPAPMCLGTTKAGAPRHPLYLPAVMSPVPYQAAGRSQDLDETELARAVGDGPRAHALDPALAVEQDLFAEVAE
jgi:hypothetical protein